AGENLDEQITGAPDEFMSKPKWQRLCVAFAGPVMNILTALVITATIAMVHHDVPSYMDKPAFVAGGGAGSAAGEKGGEPGGVIHQKEKQAKTTHSQAVFSVGLYA